MKKLLLLMLLGLICLTPNVLFANAEILYEQLPGVSSNGGASSSAINEFNDLGTITADDFLLANDAMVTGINWWGRSSSGGENFEFTFYVDGVTTYDPSLPAPGEMIHATSGSFVSNPVNVGSLADPLTYYSATFDTPLVLEQGKFYWVSVYNNAEDAVWYWANSYQTGDSFSQLGEGSPLGWTTIMNTAAVHFQLVGTTDLVPDMDGDTIEDGIDNCPETYNPNQSDMDDDGIGDVCDIDADGDNFTYNTDCNDFDLSINPAQCDIRSDGIDQDCDGLDRTTGKPCLQEGDVDSLIKEGPGETCSDGIDNDQDGLVDCNDPGCLRKQYCK